MTRPDGGRPHGDRHSGHGHRLCLSPPVTGYAPELRDLLPADPEHVRQENKLRTRFLNLSLHLDCREEGVASAALVALIPCRPGTRGRQAECAVLRP